MLTEKRKRVEEGRSRDYESSFGMDQKWIGEWMERKGGLESSTRSEK